MSDRVRLQQIEQRLGHFAIERHEVTVGVILEQPGSGFEDIPVVLDESFRTRIRLTNLAFSPVQAQEPVVAQRVCVLLLSDPDSLRRLSLEAVEAPGAHGHVRAQL